MATRKQLMRIEAQGAGYEEQGYSVSVDYRYELLVDYLKLSHTYAAICKSKGELIRNAPKDWNKVKSTYADFQDVFAIPERHWWRDIGIPLFGIKARASGTFVIGSEDALKNKALFNNANRVWQEMSNPELLVLAIPKNQTKQQALKQVTELIRSCHFSSAAELKTKPKYTLVRSKLQKHTLALGIEALKLYKQDIPLWKIGYKLRLSHADCKNVELNKNLKESKDRLQIYASKLVRKAELIGENAARGKFPSDKPLSLLRPRVARKAGRPKSK